VTVLVVGAGDGAVDAPAVLAAEAGKIGSRAIAVATAAVAAPHRTKRKKWREQKWGDMDVGAPKSG
jgi:hypothetical protein